MNMQIHTENVRNACKPPGRLVDPSLQHFAEVPKRLSDNEVADWLICNDEMLKDDSEYAAQFTNGVCTFFLLTRINAILLGQRLAECHNAISFRKNAKNAVYFSRDLVESHRDVRIHFPRYASSHSGFEEAIVNARKYVNSHLINPVCQQLADIDLIDYD
uniref:Uncharacterized protein n=1 Tax=Ditylenchus dipsaci TaxID=166011 RepID=A0A915DRQ2_9BILA